jgi:hypothetical protein
MSRDRKIIYGIGLVFAVVSIALMLLREGVWQPAPSITMEGSVLKQNSDPSKQTPLPDVTITASDGTTTVEGKSAPSGFFSLTLGARALNRGKVTLTFTAPEYEPLVVNTETPGDQLYVVRLRPLKSEPLQMPSKASELKNVLVRFSSKDESTVSIGSLAKQFTAPNKGDVPCQGAKPCSPDGRWKATQTDLPLDAEEGNQFRNVRISCMAGPCAFTRVVKGPLSRPAQKVTVSVLNWSDTTNFLVEADVTRTMVAERVRHSYPFIVGQTMSFALPPGAQGTSIEADLDDQHIVFPLGPALLLSWATCSMEVGPENNQIYRCQAKPGYRFQQ